MAYSTEFEVLTQVLRWLEQEQAVVLFCVAQTWGSAPRSPGALLAVRLNGDMVGSVSGGCVEDDLRARVLAGEFTQPTVRRYGVTPAEGERFGLPCGGQLVLVAEPLRAPEQVQAAVSALQRRALVRRRLWLENGQVDWDAVEHEAPLEFDGRSLACTYGPAWRLLLIGAAQSSRYLAEFALALNYEVVVCDPREVYTQSWPVAAARLDRRMPDDAVQALVQDSRCAVVALTHDPKLDDMGLMEALLSPAFYVGALGSQRNSEARRQRLLDLGLPAAAVARLRAPVGLPLGSRTPPEIAIAVLAEMTALRHQRHAAVTAALSSSYR